MQARPSERAISSTHPRDPAAHIPYPRHHDNAYQPGYQQAPLPQSGLKASPFTTGGAQGKRGTTLTWLPLSCQLNVHLAVKEVLAAQCHRLGSAVSGGKVNVGKALGAASVTIGGCRK